MHYVNKLDLIFEDMDDDYKADAAEHFNKAIYLYSEVFKHYEARDDVKATNMRGGDLIFEYIPPESEPEWDPQSDNLLDAGDKWGSEVGPVHVRMFKTDNLQVVFDIFCSNDQYNFNNYELLHTSLSDVIEIIDGMFVSEWVQERNELH